MELIKMPNKIRTKTELLKLGNNDLVRIQEISILADQRLSTIKYYADIGILPFEQEGIKLTRRFKKNLALKRLQEIKTLKSQGKTIDQIIAKFKQ